MSTIVIDNNIFEGEIIEASLETGYDDFTSMNGITDRILTRETLNLTVRLNRTNSSEVYSLFNGLRNNQSGNNTIKNDGKLNKKYNTIKFYKE